MPKNQKPATLDPYDMLNLSINEIGAYIRNNRKVNNLTQQQLGELVTAREGNPVYDDSARVIISKIENGVTVPSANRMSIICDILHIKYPKYITKAIKSRNHTLIALRDTCRLLTLDELRDVLEYAKKIAYTDKKKSVV